MQFWGLRKQLWPGYVADPQPFVGAFPTMLKNEAVELSRLMPSAKSWSEPNMVWVQNEMVAIPYRLIAEPFEVSDRPELEQAMYRCLYSRSVDGYVREASIKRLITMPYNEWMAPYLFLSMADYVIEVATIVPEDPGLVAQLKPFVQLNQSLYRLALARAISYWDLNRSERGLSIQLKDYTPYTAMMVLEPDPTA